MTEKQCLKALCRIQCGAKRSKKCEDCECFDDKVNIWKCVENTQESLVLRQLIREHFELVKKYDELYERHSKILDDVHDYRYETLSMKMTIRNLCKHFGVKNEEGLKNIYLCKSYKFEDLKELIGKPIFDYKYKEFYILAEVKEEELYKDEGLEKIMICSDKKGLMRVYFEEGRFFPPTKAFEYQE